jgi:hypothetical protein
VCCGGAPLCVLNPPQHLRCGQPACQNGISMSKVHDQRPASAVVLFVIRDFLVPKSYPKNDIVKSLSLVCLLGLLGSSWFILGCFGGPAWDTWGHFWGAFSVIFRCFCGSVREVLSRRVLAYFVVPSVLRRTEFGLGQTQFYATQPIPPWGAFGEAKTLQNEVFWQTFGLFWPSFS